MSENLNAILPSSKICKSFDEVLTVLEQEVDKSRDFPPLAFAICQNKKPKKIKKERKNRDSKVENIWFIDYLG
jgi:hypothetical protein